jgi:predicted nucleotidyltransferase
MKDKFESAIENLMGEFSRHKEILAVYVYGSIARGDYSLRHSDLDLFIVLNKTKIPEKLKEQITERIISISSRLGVKAHPEFQGREIRQEDQTILRKIIEEGKCIYSSGVFVFAGGQLGLKQYIIYEYSLKNSPKKSYFSKTLHGRKSWYYKNNKRITKEYKGIIDCKNIIALGKGVLLVSKEKQKDIEQMFNNFKAEYRIIRLVYG